MDTFWENGGGELAGYAADAVSPRVRAIRAARIGYVRQRRFARRLAGAADRAAGAGLAGCAAAFRLAGTLALARAERYRDVAFRRYGA